MSDERAEGRETPSRFARSPRLKTWFVRGFQDASNDHPMYEKGVMSRYFGLQGCEAYRAGYEAGREWKAESQKRRG